ncbi:MAG: PAS domain S-box protein [Deltaproteobacteria bacterium]|nr:PAS domain S-box protein [Deltaproteobacteria bacterium]
MGAMDLGRRFDFLTRLAAPLREGVRDHDRMRAVFESAFEFVGLLSPDGTLLEANRRSLAFIGATRDDVVGRKFWDTPWWTEGERPRLREAISRAARGEFVRFETVHAGVGGNVASFDFSLTPITRRGRVVFLVPEGRDITERLRAEVSLRESEARFSGIVSLAAEAIVSIDRRQRVTLFNRGAERVFGYLAGEVLGRSIDMLLPATAVQAHRDHVDAFAREHVGGRSVPHQRHVIGRRKSGETFEAEASISKMEIGREPIFTAVLRDITERRRLEQTQEFLAAAGAVLTESLDRAKTLQHVADLATRWISDGCVIYLTAADGELDPAAISHRDPVKLRALQDTLARYPVRGNEEGATLILRSGTSVVLPEFPDEIVRGIARDETHLQLIRALDIRSYVGVALQGPKGILGVITIFSGEASRRLGEHERLTTEELARRTVMAIENARLYEAAQRATGARDDVLGVVAHDLRSPLNGIVLNARLLRRQHDPEAVEAILHAASRMSYLIGDLLDVVQIEAGQLAIRCDRQPAAALVAEALTEAMPLAHDHALVSAAGDALPDVFCDRARVLQVFSNLIGNALKFTPVGGKITVGAAAEPDAVRFWVKDEGSGISPEQRERVFNRFWQAAKGDRRGAGLGLPISRGIVEAHAGALWLEDDTTRGSTFCFRIPRAP